MPITAPYGSWKSPITSDLIVSRTFGVGSLLTDGEDLYWLESRPAEKGRVTIMRLPPDGQLSEILPDPYNARTRVHEYGGGSYLPCDGVVYFSNFADQRVYRFTPGGALEPITPPLDLRYADFNFDRQRGRLLCVREDHTNPAVEAVNTLVDLKIDGSDAQSGGRVLVSGNTFYSDPRLSPDGSRMCWLTWNHPNMPWDGTELWLADVAPDGSVLHPRLVAGGLEESIFQPSWSPDGRLYFISDRTGWWNLYRWENDQALPLHPMEAEFGAPQWSFDISTYAFESAGRMVCSYFQGQEYIALLDTSSLEFTPLALPYTEFGSVRALPDRAFFICGSPVEKYAVARLDLTTRRLEILRRSMDLALDPAYFSIPREIVFPTENGMTAYAYYYPPTNPDYIAPADELPPLIVESHGGPTGSTSTAFNLSKQYWTSRGFALLDVNYGGSTGYGRAYRNRLRGQWGIVDMDDCVNGALYAARQGLADPQRLAIHGGSAGGYTTLCALVFRKVFQAGASYFGVSDAEALAKDTHKFESRYLDSMIGPYPAARQLYRQRSPIDYAGQLSSALILFQGSEDRVVPPDQSRRMYEAAREKGLPVAYLEFEGEQHGFRQAQNIRRMLDGELYFYSKIFGFDLPEAIEPVKIENLQKSA